MNQCNRTEEGKLLAELTAIEHWDRDYHRQSDHSLCDREAYKLRQQRRQDILKDIRAARQVKSV